MPHKGKGMKPYKSRPGHIKPASKPASKPKRPKK
jgi:hypothetical protein